jgi:3-phosphoshikimate 1-carboxyvinyltransferase
MAAAIAATACRGPVTILGAQAVQKSYPDFFEVYRSLGGETHVL